MKQERTALLSSYNKTLALLHFAKQLKKRNWQILASGGTATFLAQNKLLIKDVADIVGPPILGHRVVTLAREIHAGLLARDEDQTELDALGLDRIDLVYVDLYPLRKELSTEGKTFKSVLEKIDIGGPTLLRAAAKGRRLVLCQEYQMEEVISFLDGSALSPKDSLKFLAQLAAEAEETVADYCSLSVEFNRLVADGQIK